MCASIGEVDEMVWGLFEAQSGGLELDALSFTGGEGQHGSYHLFNHGGTGTRGPPNTIW